MMDDLRQEAESLHNDVLALWVRYQDLCRAALVLQAELDGVQKEAEAAGRRIREIYIASDSVLDGKSQAEGPP